MASMIVTIDGPAGAGKSSAARSLAQRLGFLFLDTGAMYRAVAYAALTRKIDLHDEPALAELAKNLSIELAGDRVLLDHQDVTRQIRTMEVTAATRFAASNPKVRALLVDRQRAVAAGHDVVAEGRDQGTVAFPEAQIKIFLTASAEERARRRMHDLAARGETIPFDDVLARQEDRDRRDRQREVGPLIPAKDAIHVMTDGLTPEEVVAKLEALVRGQREQSSL